MKHRRRRERETHFRRVENPQDDDVVPARRRYPSRVWSESAGASRSEIRMINPRLRTVAAISSSGSHEIGRAAGGLTLERRHQPAEMAGTVPRRQVFGDSILEQEQADRVALRRQEIGDRGRRGARVVALAVRPGSIAHRPAGVDHEIATEVGLVLEPLHVIAVRASVETPVEIARIVAGAVLAVLAELDREPVVRAAVDALDEAFDGDAWP